MAIRSVYGLRSVARHAGSVVHGSPAAFGGRPVCVSKTARSQNFASCHAPRPGRPWSGSDCLIDWLGSPQSSEAVMSTSSFIDTTFSIKDDIAVRNLIAAYLGVEAQRVSHRVRFKDLGAGWLDRLDLVIALEDHFDIELDDVADKILVVGDLIRFIEASRPH